MSEFRPTGKVEYGGTYNGNPISMAATLATIEELEGDGVHEHLFDLGERLRNQLNDYISERGLRAQVVGFGSVFQLLFTDGKISDYRDTLASNIEDLQRIQKGMMEKGVFLVPHANKRCHISAAHTIEDVDFRTAREVLEKLRT